jgi:outer membrane biosynthesis protein TonB
MENDTARESVKRISANFELELLRLIKTLNLLSQSKELFRTQAAGMEAFISGYRIRLNDLKARLARMGDAPAASGDPFATPSERPPVPDYLFDITRDIESYLDEIGSDLEKLKTDYVGKLDTVYSVYNLELGASQTDLDTRLKELEKELIRAVGPAPAAEKAAEPETAPVVHPVPPTPEETAPERTFVPRVDYIGPDPTVDNITTLKPNGKKPEEAETKPPEKTEQEKSEKKEVKTAKPSGQAAQAGFKSPYVMNAVLLIMGLILGVIFYDALMRTWGIQDYTSGRKIEAQAPVSAPAEAPAKPEAEGKAAAANQQPKEPAAAPKPVEPAPRRVEIPAITEPEKPQQETAQTETGETASATGADAEPAPAETTSAAVKTAGAGAYTVIGAGANVRSGPGMGYDVVTEVSGGETLTSTGEVRGRWVKVTVPGGGEGWISSKLLREAR